MVEADSHQLKLIIASFIEIYKVFEHIDMLCCPRAYDSSLKQLCTHYFVHIVGFWVT
jgi:hypothetical protein